jgi:hypothetical protein
LNGKTVLYASSSHIRDTLNYDFAQEKIFNYKGLNQQPRRRAVGVCCSGKVLDSGFNNQDYAPEGRGIKPFANNKGKL